MRYFRLLYASVCLVACSPSATDLVDMTVVLDTGIMETRSVDPDEIRISDVNVFLFNSTGLMEEHFYIDSKDITQTKEGCSFSLKMLEGAWYSMYVCANLGYAPKLRTKEDVLGFRYWLSRPDDYSRGIVMCGEKERITAGKDIARIQLKRIMSKVTIDIDKRRLDSDVSLEVTKVKIGNCPRSVPLFGTGSARSDDDVFAVGFQKDKLPATVYLLENMGAGKYASYIELEAEYDSKEKYTADGNRLRYRFHIADGEEESVMRNHHYRITVLPEGDGLGGVDVSNWRIDKEDLSTHYSGTPYLIGHPANYIECEIGDTVHLWCEVYPPDTKFTIDPDNLENDTSIGLYDYKIDDDGFGITLYWKKGGTGHVYMEADAPIDDAELFVIVCEP